MSEQIPDHDRPQTPPPAPAYQAAPSYTEGSYGQAAPAPATPPAPLALAVKLMYAGAALSVISILLGFLQKDSMRGQVVDASPKLSPSEIDTAINVALVFATVVGLIGAGLWVLNAVFNARGAKWARVLATVLGGLAVVFTLIGFSQPAPTISRVLSIIQLVLAAAILFLIWRPESSRYYEARNPKR